MKKRKISFITPFKVIQGHRGRYQLKDHMRLSIRGLTSKNDKIHINIQINGTKLVLTYEYVWAIATVIFSYTGSPQVKISQKVLGGGLVF